MSIEVRGITDVTIMFNGTNPVLVSDTSARGPYDSFDWPRRLTFNMVMAVEPTEGVELPVIATFELSAYRTYALRSLAEQILAALDHPTK